MSFGINAQRVIAPQNEVCIFTNFYGANPVADMQHFGGVKCYHFQCLIFGKTAILYALCRFLVQAAGHLSIIAVDGHVEAHPRHNSSVVGDCVLRFRFIVPPVAECGSVGTMVFHFIGYFIAFQNMGESIYRKFVFISHP